MKKKRRSIILKRIVLSYIAIIIIPIILTSIMQLSVMSTVKKGIVDENIASLNLLKNELDRNFIRLRQLSYSLALSHETASFENNESGRESYKSFLKIQRGIYSDVDYFAIYFKDYDMIMSSTGYYIDARNFYDVYYSEFNITYDEFCSEVLNCKKSSYMFLENTKNHENGLSYVLPLDFDATLPNACVIASIPSDRYALLVEKIGKKLNSSIIISNKNNEYFLGDEALGNVDLKKLNNDSYFATTVVNGEKTVLCYVDSEISGWKYISAKPEKVFWEKNFFVISIWITTLTFCILLGCIMIVFLSKRNYNPIKNIVNKLSDYNSGKDEANEFVRIETAISSMSKQYNDMRSYLKSQEKNLRNVFISSFLKNEIKNPNLIFDELSRFDIAFPYRNFVVVIAEAKNKDNLFGKEGHFPENLERHIFIDLILSNILTELLSEKNIAVPANIYNRTVLIINTESTEEKIDSLIKDAVFKLNETVKKEFSLNIICSVSALKTGVFNLPACYSEAEKTIEAMQMSSDEKKIVFYTEFLKAKGSMVFYPIKEQQLINSIKLGDGELCKKAIKEMLDFGNESISSKGRIKYRGYEIAMIMIRLLEEYNVNDAQKNKIYDLVEEIEKSKSFTQMAQILSEISEEMCLYSSENETLSDEGIAAKAKKIVLENYNNINLSVSFISEILFLAPNYLSRVFKEQTNENLLGYIQRVRISMAKKLLKNSELNIEQISIKTGFSNSDSFRRVFKKEEGITPGDYRKLN